MELKMMGGGAPVDYKKGTAIASHVLASEKFIAGDRELKTGTMKDCGNYQNAGMREGSDYYAFNKAPEGYYHATAGNESWAPELRCPKSTVRNYLGVSAGSIAKGKTIAGIAGNFYGNKAAISAEAARGFGADQRDDGYEESFTLPAAGIVYYGGFSACYRGYSGNNTICEIWKNNSVVDARNIDSWNWNWRGTMFNKSFTANAGDKITVKAYARNGVHVMSCIQAVIVYGY